MVTLKKFSGNLVTSKHPSELASKLRNRPSKRPLRGVPVRRIDHVNLMVSDVITNTDFMVNTLGIQIA